MLDPRSHILRRLAVALSLLTALLALAGLALAVGVRSVPYYGWGFRGLEAVVAMLFAVLGLLILLHHPEQILGWVYSAMALMFSLQAALTGYGTYALLQAPGALPGGVFAAWAIGWIWVAAPLPLVLLIVLFPNGRLPSTRWRLFIGVFAFIVLLETAVIAVTPGPLQDIAANLENPFGWDRLSESFALGLETTFLIMLAITLVASLISLVIRLFRSRGLERQQFKWFVFAATLLIITVPAAFSPSRIAQLAYIAAVCFLPVAMGIAILRYRLYDIDLIIRRALVYGVLTGLLALVYFGTVALLQSLVTAVSGRQSAVVIVASTLAIAALFSPLRRRVQEFIDRRFYRRKYDAARTLFAFSQTMRDETDLERLAARLPEVIHESMQPASVSLWLRPTPPRPEAPP